MKHSKVFLAYEIFQAMAFFGIPAEKYNELKKQHGSLEALHTHLGNMFTK